MIKNLDKINILKREKVKKGLEFIEQNNSHGIINKIVVFGSAVREDCTEDSDIDMCIFSDFTTKNREFFLMMGKMQRAIDDICDIFRYADITEKYQNIINERGIVVYEARND